jgi:hypothetical protein
MGGERREPAFRRRLVELGTDVAAREGHRYPGIDSALPPDRIASV